MADYSQVIAENPKGKLTFANDALIVESKEQPGGQWDTPEVCFHTGNAGAGKISWRKPDNGVWREHMMLLASQGDGFAFQQDRLGDGSDGQDPDMKKLLLVNWDGASYNVPIIGGQGPNGSGHFAIQTAHGFYLCVTPQGRLETRTQIGPWESFRLVPVANPGW